MSSEEKSVSLFGGASAPAATAGGLRSLARAAATSQGDALFLKMTKAGEWLFGPEEIEVSVDELFAVNSDAFFYGVIGWEDGNLVGEVMYHIDSGKQVDHSELKEIRPGDSNGWKDQLQVDLQSLEEEDLLLRFATSSKGGKKMMGALAGDIADKKDEGSEYYFPVVQLHTESYKHKKFGKIHNPVMKIVRWINRDGEPEPEAGGKKRNLTA